MNMPSVSYDVVDESEYFYVFVKVGFDRVGELLVNKVDDDRARLSDIKVERQWKRSRHWIDRLKQHPFRKLDTINFRKFGIGTHLIQQSINWCLRNAITELYGSIVPSDLEETPNLLEWYQRLGFRICEPLDGCLPHAVKMVVLEFPQPRNPSNGSIL